MLADAAPFAGQDLARLPEPATEAAPPQAAAPVSALPSAAAPAPVPPVVAPVALPSQVIVHFPPSAEATAVMVRDALTQAGVGQVDIVPVRFAIGHSNIRFYHDADRDGAAALSPLVSAALPDEPAPEARDFTNYATPTAPGKVEIWLAGVPLGTTPAAAANPPSAPAAAVTGLSSTRRTASEPKAPAVAVAPRLYPGTESSGDQAEAVERILIQRLQQGSN